MEEQPKKVIYEISIESVIKVLLLFALLWVAYLIKDVLIMILVVIIITTALDPFVQKLSKQGIPRALSVIVLYLAVISLLSFFIYFLIPPIVNQMKELTLNIPYYTNRISEINFGSASSTISNIIDGIATKLSSAGGNFLNSIFSVFGGVVSGVTVLVLTYYFLIEENGVRKMVVSFLPVNQKERFLETMDRVSMKLGDWMRGQLTLMLFIGVIDWIALSILGVPYALVLGFLSGLLEVIPVIGPIIAAVVAVFIALISSVVLWKILAIVIIYTAVQQIEGQLLVPRIMQKAVGISPIVVILAILIGSKLLGLSGAVLAIPVVVGVQVFLEEYTGLAKRRNSAS
jgi:predicted PurR-regulated permease PerM